MNYEKIANVCEKIASTTKRLEKTEYLRQFLEDLPVDNKDSLYLFMGEIYPEYDERKLGISEQLVIKVIGKTTGNETKKIIAEWKKIGDLGKVAEKLIESKKQISLESKTLLTKHVISELRKLPELVGNGTVDKKLAIIAGLLSAASPLEAKYITRLLLSDLRIGIQESTIRDSIAKAFFPDIENAQEIVQKALDKSNDVAEVFAIAKERKIKKLEDIQIKVGIPIRAMLAQKVDGIEAGFKAVGTPCAIEYKYDGFRLIIHKDKDKITLFTRKLENVTKQFPEVEQFVKDCVKAKTAILDCEGIGYDKKTKEYTSFQAISQRIRRKYDIEEVQEKLPIEVDVFDILFYNGESQLDKPYSERSALLREIITSKPYKLVVAKQIITSDLEEAKKFYNEALQANQEGVMMKSLDAGYKPGKRVGQMLKVKPDERDYDLVITGAEYGTGKRSGWMSSFTLSCKKGEEFLEIGKVGTGISEKTEDESKVSFDELTKLLTPLIEKESGKDVKVTPKIVVAIHYQEIQKSPTYSSGYALRFPRITTLREDKPLEEITSFEEVERDFFFQKSGYKNVA